MMRSGTHPGLRA